MSTKPFTIVPPNFAASDLSLKTLLHVRQKYWHVTKHEHRRLKEIGAIEPLDETKRVWRFLGGRETDSSTHADGSLVSFDIPWKLRQVIYSEITGRAMEERPGTS